MRLIEAESVLYALVEEGQNNATKYGFHIGDTIKFTPTQVDEIVSRMPTVEPEPHWIPCSERLPEKCGVYLVSGSNWVWLCELVQIMTVYGWANDARNPVVTAWMPLPEPYQEGAEE